MAEEIKKISKENDISVLDVLELVENFYAENLKNNIENHKNRRTILTFLNKLETAKSQLNRYVNPDAVLENLFFQ